MAEYEQAFVALVRAVPGPRDVPCGHPVHALDDAVLALWCESFTAVAS